MEVYKDSMVLSWEPPTSNGGVDITNYVIEKRDTKRNTWSHVATIDSANCTHSVQKLLEGNEYFFRVSAENEVGVGEPAELFEGTIAKSPYSKLIATC